MNERRMEKRLEEWMRRINECYKRAVWESGALWEVGGTLKFPAAYIKLEKSSTLSCTTHTSTILEEIEQAHTHSERPTLLSNRPLNMKNTNQFL